MSDLLNYVRLYPIYGGGWQVSTHCLYAGDAKTPEDLWRLATEARAAQLELDAKIAGLYPRIPLRKTKPGLTISLSDLNL